MERMGSLDAVFIAVEDAVNHMHIGSVGIFEGPVPSYEAVRALLAVEAPGRSQISPAGARSAGECRPALVDRRRRLRPRSTTSATPRCRPATGSASNNLVGRVMSHPLDRRQPLWEMWLIEGLER